MAGVDPISLGIGGAAIGALTNKKDPLKGAVMGGALGYGGASLAAMGSTGTAAGAAGAVNPYAAPVVDATRQAMVTQGGNVIAAGATPEAMAALDSQNAMAALAAKGTNPMSLAMMGNQLLSQKSQQTPSTQFRAGQAINSADPIAALLEPKRKKKEQFSLL